MLLRNDKEEQSHIAVSELNQQEQEARGVQGTPLVQLLTCWWEAWVPVLVWFWLLRLIIECECKGFSFSFSLPFSLSVYKSDTLRKNHGIIFFFPKF